jgi:hypothetical protein
MPLDVLTEEERPPDVYDPQSSSQESTYSSAGQEIAERAHAELDTSPECSQSQAEEFSSSQESQGSMDVDVRFPEVPDNLDVDDRSLTQQVEEGTFNVREERSLNARIATNQCRGRAL